MNTQSSRLVDEIDLLDIFRILMHQKWLILGITVFCTGLAVLVALVLPREYRTELILLPPLAETVEKLYVHNPIGSSEPYLFEVDAQKIYQELIENIQSNELQREFYNRHELTALLTTENDTRQEGIIFMEEFRKKIVIGGINNKGAREFVTITFEGKNPAQITDWMNQFVSFADRKTIQAQLQTFVTKVQRMKDSVSQRIKSLRVVEKSRRYDLIARLEEAIAVAENLGWVEQQSAIGLQYEQAEKGAANMSFSLQDVPLYLRGVKALKAEVDILKKRKNDDPFILELRGLQEQFEFLSSVKQNADNIHAMRLDKAAIVDDRPVKPNRKFIVVLGFMLGVLLAVFAAFIRHMIRSAKKESIQP